jgi:hypothetical protein
LDGELLREMAEEENCREGKWQEKEGKAEGEG